ncbi:periplasmic oligopeptide-binding protein precursor [mine drainage metagenome]|uniref:Periplasmic oligopeptide-binding protein n=1 Tax=mine drainage metagenome TaxID=410659 RepID=A0A1J5TQZ1_9ZZZZ
MRRVFPTLAGVPALLAALAVVLSLAGCGHRETLVERGDRLGILHRGIGQELSDLDPALATQDSDYSVLSALFEGLVSEDPVDLHPVPGVAQGWDVSPDRTVYTFHLRATARWSDGTPVTADDFVQSIRRVLSPAMAAPNASQMYVIRGAEDFNRGKSTDFSTVGVQAVDAHTLRITLAHPTPYFLSMLNQSVWFPVNIASIARTGAVFARGNPWARPGRLVGDGPFNLKEWSLDHRIVVVKSPTYWDAKSVRLNGIDFYPYGVETEERVFRAGQLHVTDALPPDKVDWYRKHDRSELRIDPLLGTYFYRINTRIAVFADPRVRQALSLAVDRKTICARILRGGQKPAHSFTPPGTAGYEPPEGPRFDPAEARRLLAAAGYPGGKGFPGIEILYNSSEAHRQIAEAIQAMWRRELGISASLTNMELTSVLDARRTGSFQILRSSWTGDYDDPQDFLEIWESASGNNFTGWHDPAYDALVDRAAATQDNRARFALLRQAEARLLKAAPIIPIYFYTHVYLVDPSVQGWYPNLLDHHPYKYVWLKR